MTTKKKESMHVEQVVQSTVALAEARRIETLTRENAHLRRQLTQAELIIDVQKKVASLLGVSMALPALSVR